MKASEFLKTGKLARAGLLPTYDETDLSAYRAARFTVKSPGPSGQRKRRSAVVAPGKRRAKNRQKAGRR